jgi:hypothetical protein
MADFVSPAGLELESAIVDEERADMLRKTVKLMVLMVLNLGWQLGDSQR